MDWNGYESIGLDCPANAGKRAPIMALLSLTEGIGHAGVFEFALVIGVVIPPYGRDGVRRQGCEPQFVSTSRGLGAPICGSCCGG